jgi:hypothetical protein
MLHVISYQSMVIHAEFLHEYKLSLTTHGMSRNASKAVTILPLYTPNSVHLRAKRLVRDLTQGKAQPPRELCNNIAIKKA